MAENDHMLIAALKSKPVKLNLSNRKLTTLSSVIGKIPSLQSLVLKVNKLVDLPCEVSKLVNLTSINLGNNNFAQLPQIFKELHGLKTLHLFNNQIKILDDHCLGGLANLVVLNLNDNELEALPKSIVKLHCLEVLSVNNNFLSELPAELSLLRSLVEVNVNNNRLKCLPENIGFLINLEKLCARKNKLVQLPEGIGGCASLKVLDISGNFLASFPSEIIKLDMNEIYFEENNLIQDKFIFLPQKYEVLALKELSARFVLVAIGNSSSIVRRGLTLFPAARDILKMASVCFVCGGPFLNTWLDCVKFMDCREVFHTKAQLGVVPIRAPLCSYRCFNSDGHEFYGVAQA